MEAVDAIVVLSFKVEPEQIVDVLHAIDPPHLPHFAGQARIAVGTDAAAVIDWLEDRTDTLPADTILCSDPACTSRRWKHSHADGWPEHPSYKGP